MIESESNPMESNQTLKSETAVVFCKNSEHCKGSGWPNRPGERQRKPPKRSNYENGEENRMESGDESIFLPKTRKK